MLFLPILARTKAVAAFSSGLVFSAYCHAPIGRDARENSDWLGLLACRDRRRGGSGWQVQFV